MSTARRKKSAAEVPRGEYVPPPDGPEIHERGCRAFTRDLPELMKTHYGKAVAYYGERRFGPTDTFDEVDAQCHDAGVDFNFVIFRVVEPEERFFQVE